jgi:hypothetical protein
MGKLLLGLIIGFLMGISIEAKNPHSLRPWGDDTALYRGDKVALHLPPQHATFYKNCKATFIASVAVSDDNLAFVLLTDCDFQKYDKSFDSITADVFPLRTLERIK